jgi:hypothetical protein
MLDKNSPIAFLHIPKTAGMTLHEILTDQYPNTKHKLIYTVDYTKTYTQLSEEKKKKIGVIKGHFLYGIHEGMPQMPIYLTMLRNPIARTISGYEFIKIKKDHPFHKEIKEKKISLKDFLNNKCIDNFDNIQVRFLCGDNSMPFGTINETHLELAKKNLLSKNMLFGITEMFNEAVLYFKHELEWKNPYYVNQNVSKNQAAKMNIDDETKKAIVNSNKFDQLLYDFAKNIFEQKINSLGESFKNEMTEFKKENEKRQAKLKRRNYFRSFYTRFTQR